jgi:hypothetical protein
MTNPTTRTRAESIVETAARIKALAENESNGRFSSTMFENGRGYIYISISDNEVIALCDAVLAGGTDAAKPAGAGGVADVLFEGLADQVQQALADGGAWDICSGCRGDENPWSDALSCRLGMGCHECGGLGAIWHEALAASSDTPAQGTEP